MGTLIGTASNIYQQLKDLHIETGKQGPNEISAWYDTFDNRILDFLKWFEDYITNDNFLTYTETLIYNELLDKNLIYKESKYHQSLQEFETDYPNLFEQDSNAIELEFLEFEDELLHEELENIQKLIQSSKEYYFYLNKKRAEKIEQAVKIDFEKDEHASVSLQLAEILDKLNSNLGGELLKCGSIIENNTDDVKSIMFMSNDDFNAHKDYVDLCNFDIIRICRNELEKLPSQDYSCSLFDESSYEADFSSFTSSCYSNMGYDSFCQNSLYDKTSDIIKERLVQATSQRIYNSGRVKVAQAKIEYLLGLINNGVFKKACRQNNPISLCYKEAVVKRIDNLIKLPSLIVIQNNIAALNTKIEFYSSFQEILNRMMQYQVLLMQLFKTEISTFENIKNIFIFLQEYISCDMYQCEERIKIMDAINVNCNAYISKPFDEKWHLLKGILKAIGVEYKNVILTDGLHAILAFHDKCDGLEKKLFRDDINHFRKDIQLIKASNRTLQNFLCCNATSELTIVPFKTYSVLKSLDDLLEFQEKHVKLYTSLPKDISDKLERNKWLKIKRQLWMYFLKKPQKLEKIIDEMESEIHSKRTAFLMNK